MQRAWVMLKRSRGQGRNFWDAERRLSEWMNSRAVPFKAAIGLFAEFDFLLICEAPDVGTIQTMIRRISRDIGDEVVSTTTYLAVEVSPADAFQVPGDGDGGPGVERMHCAAIRALPGTGDETRDALKRFGEKLRADKKNLQTQIHIVDTVFGDYDVMMLFSCPYEAVYQLLSEVASQIPTIRKTTTMLATGVRI